MAWVKVDNVEWGCMAWRKDKPLSLLIAELPKKRAKKVSKKHRGPAKKYGRMNLQESHWKDIPNINNTTTNIKNITQHKGGFVVQKMFKGERYSKYHTTLELAIATKERWQLNIVGNKPPLWVKPIYEPMDLGLGQNIWWW